MRGNARRTVVATALVVLAAVVAGCSSGSSNTSAVATTTVAATAASGATTTAAAAATTTAAVDPVAAAAERVKKWTAGTNTAPPTSAPVPATGKKVWVVSCFELIESCSVPTAATAEAGKLLGWSMTVFDAGGDPDKAGTGIRNAIAAKADAVVLVAIDCGQVKQPIAEAKAAKVLVMTFYAFDCDDPNYGSGAKQFDGSVIYGDGGFKTYADFQLAIASAKVDWVIAQTQGKAKVINFTQKDAVIVNYLAQGVRNGLKNCPTCKEVATIDLVAADIATGQLVAKFQNTLLQQPDANALIMPIDAYGIFGLAQAVKDSGKSILVLGGEGYATAMAQLRNGQIAMVNAISGAWAGYAAIDGLVRLFAGQPIVPSGIGWQIITKDNAPAAGGYEPSIDFRSAYKKIWGVK